MEIIDAILHHCRVKDRLNVACSSQKINDIARPSLWSTVRVQLSTDRLCDEVLPNLKHTKHLRLLNREGPSEEANTNDEGSQSNPMDVLKRVVNACNTEQVRSLRLVGSCWELY